MTNVSQYELETYKVLPSAEDAKRVALAQLVKRAEEKVIAAVLDGKLCEVVELPVDTELEHVQLVEQHFLDAGYRVGHPGTAVERRDTEIGLSWREIL